MRKKPVYLQIRDDLKTKIEQGIYRPGDQLPTERELCEKYDVSRMTANKALVLLEQKGFIERIRGKGSYVSQNPIHKVFEESTSFSDDICDAHQKPGSVLLEYKLLDPKDIPKISRCLRCEHDKVIYFRRLRTVNEKPVAISQTYLSSRIVPRVDLASLDGSLYQYLKDEYGITPVCKDYILQATIPDDTEKKLLDIDNDALLTVTHLSFTADTEEVFEYNVTHYIGSMYTYSTSQSFFITK